MKHRNLFVVLAILLAFTAARITMAEKNKEHEGHHHESKHHKGHHQIKHREGHELKKHPSSHYYNADGSFNDKAAHHAMAQMFEHFDYSMGKEILENAPETSLCGDKLWILDFNLGDFSNVGMGGIFFVNDKEHGYFGHEIYLLPYQMIPEHCHVAAEGKPAKHEAWQVRHGSVWCFAKGGSETDLSKYPKEVAEAMKSQLDAKAITAFNGKELHVGEMTNLSGLGDSHFMMAGPHGAIVTEYASYHSGEGLKFTNPNGKVANTPAKK